MRHRGFTDHLGRVTLTACRVSDGIPHATQATKRGNMTYFRSCNATSAGYRAHQPIVAEGRLPEHVRALVVESAATAKSNATS